jgi:hypothetical protein
MQLAGMRLERYRDCPDADRSSVGHHRSEDPAMTQVNAVEVADRDNRWPERAWDLVKIGPALHVHSWANVVDGLRSTPAVYVANNVGPTW